MQPPKKSSKKDSGKKTAVLAESTKDNSSAPTASPVPLPLASSNSATTTSEAADSTSVENTSVAVEVASAPANQLNEMKFELLKSKQIKFRLFKEEKVSPKSDVIDEKEACEKKPIKKHNMYMDETMQSFFRRLTWTVDGAFLITPAGLWQEEENEAPRFCSYVFARHQYEKPVAVLECGDKPSVVVRYGENETRREHPPGAF